MFPSVCYVKIFVALKYVSMLRSAFLTYKKMALRRG